MATRITDELMTSDRTRHAAMFYPLSRSTDGPGAWVVSWLPTRALTRNQAVTAMTIAAAVNDDGSCDRRAWPHLADWASELGMDRDEAVRLVKDPLAGFVFYHDEVGPTLVHGCAWYRTVGGETLAGVIASARQHVASCGGTGV
jgi:hypothetical protein